MDDVKTQMKLKILAPLNPVLKKYYEENRIPASNGIILHGPGGVGKTFIIKALAAEAKIPLYELNLSEQGSFYINETSGNIKKICQSDCVILLSKFLELNTNINQKDSLGKNPIEYLPTDALNKMRKYYENYALSKKLKLNITETLKGVL